MRGPGILARTMSVPAKRGASATRWQYHSRSDRHSKVACWTMLFDLLLECDVMRNRAQHGQLGFRMNHVMVGKINKTLDLVVTRVQPPRPKAERRTFAGLAEAYEIVLSPAERKLLARLPAVEEDRREGDAFEVAVGVDTKACMTNHRRALRRLHTRMLATGYLAKKAAPHCISVSYDLVNAAETFRTPSGDGSKVNAHTQPGDAQSVVKMLATALPMSTEIPHFGYDAIGVTVIDCKNDGSPVELVTAAPAPTASDHVSYERMIRAICSAYRSRF